MILKAAQYSFLLLVFSLAFPRPFNIQIGGTTVPYTDIIFLLVFGLMALAIMRKELRPTFDRVFIFIGLYAVTLTIAVFGPYANPVKLLGEFYLFALCWVAFILCSDRIFFRKAVLAWLCGTSIASFAAMAGAGLFYAGFDTQETNYFLSHLGSLPAGHYPRVQALFGNPNMFCNYLNISVCFLFIAKEATWVRPWMLWSVSAAIACAAALTLSPGLGGIALSLGLLFGSHKGGLSKPIWRMVTCASGIVLAVAILFGTLISLETSNPTAKIGLPLTERRIEPSVRVLVWMNVIEQTEPRLLLGRGTGATTADLAYTQLSGERQVLADAHNMYLNVMGQAGLIGLAAFAFMVFRLTRRCRLDTQNVFWISTSCAFAGAFLYQGLTGSYEDARHLWVLIGMLIAMSRRGEDIKAGDALPASTAP